MAEAAKVERSPSTSGDGAAPSNFIRAIIEDDLRSGRVTNVVTRFPPEPSGYLHIGHAKAICLDFGLASDFGGRCHLRFDDTNPETESIEYVEAIKRDVRWLGFDWGEHEYYASDYFEQLYDFAEQLVLDANAYVDSLSEDEIREYRGTVTTPGRPSPYRDRSIEENLDLLRRMKAGEFASGEHVLRAKGDLASPNMKMRDPLLYRIRHAEHYRRGNEWCIYPMYDFAHPLSDAIEDITHSLCTLEFDNNRELYDWVLDNTVGNPRPHQYEFARANLDYTVMSKRKLLRLVDEGHVSGWDDPRLPTLAGFRRRGVTPEAIRRFWENQGVTRTEGRVETAALEHTIRDDLNFKAPRVMCVLRPLKVVITNYPEGASEVLDAPYWPHDVPREGSRKVPFGREIYIDRDDFREDPPSGYYRLAPGREVRLRYAYFIRCEEIVKDEAGEVIELRCTYDPATKGGNAPDGRRVRGTIHWVAAEDAVPVEVRLYDRLFRVPDPEADGGDFIEFLNPESLVILKDSLIEPSVLNDTPDTRYQFEREGYFWRDPVDATNERLVFNRIVALRDSWAKVERAQSKAPLAGAQKSRQPEPPSDPSVDRSSDRSGDASDISRAPTVEDRIASLDADAAERYHRLRERYDLSEGDVLVLAEHPDVAEFFEASVAEYASPASIANWSVNELLRAVKGRSIAELGITPAQLAELVRMVDEDRISGRVAKEVFDETIATGTDPKEIVKLRGLEQISDEEALLPVVDAVIDSNPAKVKEYRGGKTGLIGFFIGQVMRQTSGKANPELVRRLLEERLQADTSAG